jgi:hypothetical protein
VCRAVCTVRACCGMCAGKAGGIACVAACVCACACRLHACVCAAHRSGGFQAAGLQRPHTAVSSAVARRALWCVSGQVLPRARIQGSERAARGGVVEARGAPCTAGALTALPCLRVLCSTSPSSPIPPVAAMDGCWVLPPAAVGRAAPVSARRACGATCACMMCCGGWFVCVNGCCCAPTVHSEASIAARVSLPASAAVAVWRRWFKGLARCSRWWQRSTLALEPQSRTMWATKLAMKGTLHFVFLTHSGRFVSGRTRV